MDIQIAHGLDGAKNAKGLVVIIDVFRAFSVSCYVANNSPSEIITVGAIEEAYHLKNSHSNTILIGERESIILPGFDYGNSPSQILDVDFKDAIIVHTTSSGTQGIVRAQKADEVITGSFVNALAIVNYIQKKKPESVTLVCMGWGGTEPADEDILCGDYIKQSLLGKKTNFEKIVDYLKNESTTINFLDKAEAKDEAMRDFELCLDLNRFDFVLRAVKEKNDRIFLRKVV
ncbi:2-phosphosulfolactate phosphatase [Gracilibacillus ureilyticus]|uniref:Probable 2-phosphosulfolactate phosphatase n=1 Tax=Gracilibacillus ureilyticus TaxID=531814 RepID=A0A1H9TYT1_9BACI|nr:2-phosphosulfolactate phosphatase [Gracilibacillus ureilyticus]SES02178.1 2-phosphosulfolactate phosphatase [Gracilibacillus ureilyticus]